MRWASAGSLLPALLLCGTTAALAASISPILVELTPKAKVKSIRFTNTGKDIQVIQADAREWRQENGGDVREATDRLVVSPRIARIPQGGTQIFRVSERSSGGTVERSYRLVLEDITADVDLKALQGNEIRLRITTDLPVFSSPVGIAKATPVWSRCSAPAGKLCLRLDNQGNKRVRISNVRLLGAGAEIPVKIVDTVLAGSWKQWTVDSIPEAQRAGHVRYRSEDGEVNAESRALMRWRSCSVGS